MAHYIATATEDLYIIETQSLFEDWKKRKKKGSWEEVAREKPAQRPRGMTISTGEQFETPLLQKIPEQTKAELFNPVVATGDRAFSVERIEWFAGGFELKWGETEWFFRAYTWSVPYGKSYEGDYIIGDLIYLDMNYQTETQPQVAAAIPIPEYIAAFAFERREPIIKALQPALRPTLRSQTLSPEAFQPVKMVDRSSGTTIALFQPRAIAGKVPEQELTIQTIPLAMPTGTPALWIHTEELVRPAPQPPEGMLRSSYSRPIAEFAPPLVKPLEQAEPARRPGDSFIEEVPPKFFHKREPATFPEVRPPLFIAGATALGATFSSSDMWARQTEQAYSMAEPVSVTQPLSGEEMPVVAISTPAVTELEVGQPVAPPLLPMVEQEPLLSQFTELAKKEAITEQKRPELAQDLVVPSPRPTLVAEQKIIEQETKKPEVVPTVPLATRPEFFRSYRLPEELPVESRPEEKIQRPLSPVLTATPPGPWQFTPLSFRAERLVPVKAEVLPEYKFVPPIVALLLQPPQEFRAQALTEPEEFSIEAIKPESGRAAQPLYVRPVRKPAIAQEFRFVPPTEAGVRGFKLERVFPRKGEVSPASKKTEEDILPLRPPVILTYPPEEPQKFLPPAGVKKTAVPTVPLFWRWLVAPSITSPVSIPKEIADRHWDALVGLLIVPPKEEPVKPRFERIRTKQADISVKTRMPVEPLVPEGKEFAEEFPLPIRTVAELELPSLAATMFSTLGIGAIEQLLETAPKAPPVYVATQKRPLKSEQFPRAVEPPVEAFLPTGRGRVARVEHLPVDQLKPEEPSEELAQEVYERLKRRLRIERERSGGEL